VQYKQYKKKWIGILCFCFIALQPVYKACADPTDTLEVVEPEKERGWRLRYLMVILALAFNHPIMM
tara:strand:- start:1727 stop:1924 length:198 start_codon:yes stop_codon:yes gene_type:complete